MSKILQTPVVNHIIPFDPTQEYMFNFTYTDNQSVKNRAVITDNETNLIVYDETQTTMRLYHLLPSGILVAGNKYLIQIQVFDNDGNSSNLSSPVLFQCLSTPAFGFSNITDNEIYRHANIILELNYFQSEDEQIRNVQFFKYSVDKVLLDSSNVYYSTSTMSHTFNGLENDSIYYFRATGETNNGISLDTGYIKINVTFNTNPFEAEFKIENNFKNGYVTVDSNIIVASYEIENENYTLSNGLVDISNNSITYSDFTIKENDDFSLFVETKKIPIGQFLTIEEGVSLYVIKVCGIYYCKLIIKNSDFTQYVPISNATVSNNCIEIINQDTLENYIFGFAIRKINGYYGLEMYYK